MPKGNVAELWFRAVYEFADEGYVSLFVQHSDGRTECRWFDVADSNAPRRFGAAVDGLSASAQCWAGMAVRSKRSAGRGGADDVAYLTCVWLDLDVGEGKFESEEAALAFLNELPLAPSIALRSGGGVQATYLLAEKLDAAEAVDLLPRWKAFLDERAPAGVKLDNVHDLPRMMRVPGGTNHKYDPPRLVELLSAKRLYYGVDDLEQYLPAPADSSQSNEKPSPSSSQEGDRPGDAFNREVTAGAILERNGWTPARKDPNGDVHYLRPGKSKLTEGTGATVYYSEDGHATIWSETVLVDYPTLEANRPYDAFGLSVHLEHGGDWNAASEKLRADGYGDDRVEPRDLMPAVAEVESSTPSAPAAKDSKDKRIDVAQVAAQILEQVPIRVSGDARLWYYDGGVWKPDGEKLVGRKLYPIIGGKAWTPAIVERVVAFLRHFARTMPVEPVSQYLNFRKCLLDWRTGETVDHTPDVLSTVQLAIDWNPDAVCPAIDEFFRTTLEDDQHSFIEEVVGYALYSGNPYQKMFLLEGPGRNGKGAFLRVLQALAGKGNYSATSAVTLAANKFAAGDLYGKLLNVAGDLENRVIKDTGLLKKLSGGDEVRGEHKYGATFVFTAWCVSIFSANEHPTSADTTPGWYERWIVVPFTRTFAKQIPQDVLDARLSTPSELQGLAVRAVEGLRRLQDRGGFELPASVQHATETFRKETDSTALFVEECLVKGPGLRLSVAEVYRRYKEFANDGGYLAVRKARLVARLESLGFERLDHHADGPSIAAGKSRGW